MLEFVLEASANEQLSELLWQYVTGDLAGDIATAVLAVLLLLGSGLMLLASVGLLRLPDLPTRMHASTKAGSLGAALIMVGVAVAMPEPLVLARAFAVVAFLLLTAPVAAHIIGRAGYFTGVPLWEGTVKDDLAEQYDYERHTLASGRFADREVEGWESPVPEQQRPYDPLTDDEPPRESTVKHPVEQAAEDRRDRPTGSEKDTFGDPGAERAEGKTHQTPPPGGPEETDDADYAGESPDRPESTSDDVAGAEAEQALQEAEAGDEESEPGDEAGDEESEPVDDEAGDEDSEPVEDDEESQEDEAAEESDGEDDDEDDGDDKKKDEGVTAASEGV